MRANSLGCGSVAGLVLAMAGSVASADGSRFWIYFADKGVQGHAAQSAIDAVAAGYNQHAIARRDVRRTLPGLFDERDLPVSIADVEAVRGLGLKIIHQSRWLNAVSVEGDIGALAGAALLPRVVRVEPVRKGVRRGESMPQRVEDAPGVATDYGASTAQIQQLNLDSVHNLGYTGRGVIVGILDTGFVLSHQSFNQTGHVFNVVAAHDFVNGDANVGIEEGDHPDQHIHGTLIAGVLGSYEPGRLVGGAFDARYVLCKTEDVAREVPVEEDNYVAGLEFAEQNGADVCTSSLGYIDWYTQANLDGVTAVTSIAVNIATGNGVLCCTAAGNEGHDSDPNTSHLIAPADALDVFTCGAADGNGNIAGFSSDGPTADGRVKPEVLARGVATLTVWPNDNVNLASASGTSLSTPLVASAIACLSQARPWWSVARMRAAVLHSASDYAVNNASDPTFVRGYGMLNALAALNADCLADYNGDGVADFFDYLDFVAAFSASSRAADFNGDATIDFFDYLDFVAAFSSGC
jgi:serine protease AprX